MPVKPVVRIEAPLLTPEQEQLKWLTETVQGIRQRSTLLHKAREQKNFKEAVEVLISITSELRTGLLNPTSYYELYCAMFDVIHDVPTFLMECSENMTMDSMYEYVQHTGNIIPRLYLLVTVGAAYIRSRQAPVKEILQDLVEMCKGVQHPTRGLFLRHYLLTHVKALLPDTGSQYSEEEGTVEDSVAFILQNFKEMNWLWVRMENAKVKTQRRELRILVGYNLVRLSELEGVTKGVYRDFILPRVMQIIMSHPEPVAQQYLLEVVIQVFPDEFHLYTLKTLLENCGNVCSGVDMAAVLGVLMDRLGAYVVSLREGTVERTNASKREDQVIAGMFEIFLSQFEAYSKNANILTDGAFVELHVALIKLSLRTYPEEYDRVDTVLKNICTRFESSTIDADGAKAFRKGFCTLAEMIPCVNTLLDLANLESCIEVLPFAVRREVAVALCTAAIASETKIISLERASVFFNIIAPLLFSVPDAPPDSEVHPTPEDLREEQHLVCCALHTVDAEDAAGYLKIATGMRKQLSQGGTERMRWTFKALATVFLRAAMRLAKEPSGKATPAKALSYLHDMDGKGQGILDFLSNEDPVNCFNLYLTAAVSADACECSDISYEMFVRALTIFEENPVLGSKGQSGQIRAMISSLIATRHMSIENYDVLATKCCQYTSTCLQRKDQAISACLCSNLFHKKGLPEEYAEKIGECLKRAVKLAKSTPVAQQPTMFVRLLNQFLHFFAAGVAGIDAPAVNTVLDMMREANASADGAKGDPEAESTKVLYRNTTRYIRSRAEHDESWKEIEL